MPVILELIIRIVLVVGLSILIGFGVLCAAYAIVFFGPHLWLRRYVGGELSRGLAIWVEPIRFPGWPWGERTIPCGLQRAGYEGRFLYWKWHSAWRACLVLPVLLDRNSMEREATRLADFIAEHRREHPQTPIYLMGYSCGAFVALRALEILPDGVGVESASLMAGTFDPRHDLSIALSHVDGKLIVCASALDFVISGFATLVFGAADRVHTPAIGMLGAMERAGFQAARHPKLAQIHWRPGMIREGLFGMHDWCMGAHFAAKYLAPAMGIGGEQ